MPGRPPEAAAIKRVLQEIARRPDRALVALDVDGTVSEIVASPDGAAVEDALRETLRALSRRVHLWFVSGRDADRARDIVRVPTAGYIGAHGLEALDEHGLRPLIGSKGTRAEIGRLAESVVAEVPEVEPYVERKRWSVAFHYRAFPPGSNVPERLERAVVHHLAPSLRLRPGKKVTEVVPATDCDKGTAFEWLARETRAELAFVAGDDLTDIGMFEALKRYRQSGQLDGICIAVVQGEETPEKLRLAADTAANGVPGLHNLLRMMLRKVGAR